jgi:LacI family transcriptional regulator
MQNLLARNAEQPTAVFFASDVQAIGAMKAVREAGLRIPEDIAIIGFDDIELAAYVGLATVRQPMFQMGKQGVERLMALFEDPDLPRQHIRIQTELLIRESCGKCKALAGQSAPKPNALPAKQS